MEKINLSEKFGLFNEYWQPKIVAECNGQHVKLVKFQGSFDWHQHENEDELFLVIKGAFEMQFRNKTIPLKEGELLVVPKSIEHCPIAEEEVHCLVFEPAGTLNTGDQVTSKTVENPEIL